MEERACPHLPEEILMLPLFSDDAKLRNRELALRLNAKFCKVLQSSEAKVVNMSEEIFFYLPPGVAAKSCGKSCRGLRNALCLQQENVTH